MSGFILDGTTYETGDIRRLQVVDQIRLERWLGRTDLTDARSYEDIVALSAEIAGLPQPSRHEDFKLFVLIGIWIAKIQAGEDASLDDCGRFTWEDITFITDPGEALGKARAAS